MESFPETFHVAAQEIITKFCIIREIMTIMIIQCGCSDMKQAEDGKPYSHLKWPNGEP